MFINDRDLDRYIEWFNVISIERGVRWNVNRIDVDDFDYTYHTVAVRGDKESVFSRIMLDPQAMVQIGPECLAEQNYKYHKLSVGNVVCDHIPSPFYAFIQPKH